MTLDERIALYLEKIPPAVSGSRGHDQTFTVACVLVWGFALEEAEAMRYFLVWNAGCVPPWKERDLRHKVQQAGKVAHTKPRGYLLGGECQPRANAAQGTEKPSAALLAPRKDKLRTVRTFIFNPCVNEREENRNTYISVGDLGASEASEKGLSDVSVNDSEGVGKLWTPSEGASVESIPWPSLVAVPGCDIGRPPEIECSDVTWRAVCASGLASEPQVQSALCMFGPGCQVLETSEGVNP